MSGFRGLAFVLSVTSAASAYAQQRGAPYDLIIRHGRIIDGTGPGYDGGRQ